MTLRDWRKDLDVAANVLAIGTCLTLCAVVAFQFIERRRSEQAALAAMPPVFAKGTSLLPPPGITFADRTLLVGLSSTCRYCDQSMPAFRQLNERIRAQQAGRARAIAVAAQPLETLTEYLKKNTLTAFSPVRLEQGSKLAPLIRRTPSVVLVNREGSVLGSWPGLMTTDRIVEVFQLMDSPSARR